MLRLVLGAPLARPLGRLGRVQRCRDADDDIRREQLRAVVRLDGDAVLHLGGADLPHDRVHLEGEIDVLRGAVPHQLELAVRRHKRDDAVRVKAAQFHALVELAVFQRDGAGSRAGCFAARVGVRGRGWASTAAAVAVEEKAVVQPELALRGAGEVGAHDDLAGDVGAEHGARGGHEQVHVFDDVYEGFVLAVLDVCTAPGERACCLHCDPARVRGVVDDGRLDALRCDVHLERVRVGVLGIAKVEDF